MSAPLDIAIIGLAGVYPQAPDPQAFWRNICNKVDAITDADPEWTGPYFEAETQADDRIYTTRGGFLRELAQVDPLEVGIMPAVAAGSDPDHLIALKTARAALDDAGYLTRRFDSSRAGVVIARGTYGNRGMAGMLARGFFMDQMMDVVRHLRPDFSEAEVRELQGDLKKQLPPYGGDVVGVLTPNVIASLIANRLDFMGPAFIVDAACASSLIAIDAAAQELVNGRCDLMLAGGTHVQTPPQLFIQFCQIGALSRDRLRPFQKGSEGTLLGEGCGMLVLKRLADAERDQDRIYAVIKGIGTASDGRAKGLLAPRLEGEVLALRRAYESSGIDPLTVDLIEAHGTGTSVGDKTEIEALTQIFAGRGVGPRIAISAVKSMIGHCLPGTGAASMIKTALALHHQVLPPMLCDEPDPALALERTPFYINNRTRPWVHGADTPRRAGVNAFGFGGINAHVILEQYVPRSDAARASVPALHSTPAASELLLLAADTHAQLVGLCRAALAHLNSADPPSLAQLCCGAAAHARGTHRLAIVAADAGDLQRKLELAREKLSAGSQPFKTRNGTAYGSGAAPGKLCVLFPGEGSQYPDMLAELCVQFPQVRDWFDFIEESAHARGARSRAEVLFPAPTMLDDTQRRELENALFDMDLAAETVFAASLGLQALFDDLGLVPDAMLGHSTGENTALTACRVRRYTQRGEVAEAVQAVNHLYRKLEAEGRIVHGSLLSVGGLTADTRSALLDRLQRSSPVQLAMDNCPNQVVLFGPREEVLRLRDELAADGAICMELPFGRAYHTPLFKPLADAFRTYFATLDFGPGRVPLYSARSCAPFPDAPDAIRELTAQQWENPVRFTQTIERLYADGFRVFLEVGPSANLTAFVADTLRTRDDVLALSANSRRKPALAHLQQTLGALFVAGIGFDAARLYAHRAIATFDLLADPRPAKKAMPKFALTMPHVRLPEKWKRPLPVTAGSGAPAPPAALAAAASLSAMAPVSATAPVSASAPADARLAALQSHFSLMQDFLDSQSRMLGLVTGQPIGGDPAAAARAAATAAFPLLGVEIERGTGRVVFERTYDLDSDPFLRDHCLGGRPSLRDPALHAIPVMPFTFSMEICAQAAARLIDDAEQVVIAIDNARGSRWLTLDQGHLHLRIVAERQAGPDARVHCRLFLLDQGGPAGGIAVFEAMVKLATAYPEAPAALEWTSPDALSAQFNADGQLYQRGMFHGPRLQGARRILRWGQSGIDTELQVIGTQDYFACTAQPRMQTDATLADVLGQTLYYWLQEQHGGRVNCFPFQVARTCFYAPPQPAGTRVSARAQISLPAPERLLADVEALGSDGGVLLRMQGFEDRTFAVADRYTQFRLDPPQRVLGSVWMDGLLPPGLHARRVDAFADDLLASGGGIWGRGLAHMVLDRIERAEFYALPAAGEQRHAWLLGRIAAKEAARDWYRTRLKLQLASADIGIRCDARGRFQIEVPGVPGAAPAVSIAHSAGRAVAVVADPGLAVGVDYRRLDQASDATLIPDVFSASEKHWLDAGGADQRRLMAGALHCAKQAAARASGLGSDDRPTDGVIVAAQLDPRSVSFGSARVSHDGREFEVAVQFEGSEAVSALCLQAAAVDDPLPPAA